MSHSKRRKPHEDKQPVDAWPANTATEPSVIIERVKNVIENRHDRGEDLETATNDVVEDLAEQDVPRLLEKASNWIAIVGVERRSEDVAADEEPSSEASKEEVDPRDAIRCEDVAPFKGAGGEWEEIRFEPFGGTTPIVLRLPPGDPDVGRYRQGEVYDVHEIASKLKAAEAAAGHPRPSRSS